MWVVLLLFLAVVLSLFLSMISYPPPTSGRVERE